MADRYARIINAAMTTPWAITPEKAMIIRDILQFRAAGGRLTAEEIRARVGAAMDEDKPKPRQSGLVAVIPVWGVIAHRTFDASSGMTSTEMIGGWLRKAVDDEEVSAIILDISSPGGMVDGTPELSAEVFAARKVKPVYAIANAMAASAAYWVGSQATEFSMIPSGTVGSIGCYMISEDWSEYLAKEGIKFNPISAGDFKLEGAWWEPLSDDARAHYQAQVDTIYADFLKAVARGRNTTVANAKKTFGQGRCYDAAEALSRGMVDRVETFDQLIARVSGIGKRRGGTRAESEERTRLERLEDRRIEEVADAEPRMTLAAARADADPATATVPKFKVGDRVVSLVDHMEGMKGMAGAVNEANAGSPPYYAIDFDEPMGKGNPHKWLNEDEIEAEEAADDEPMAVTENQPAAADRDLLELARAR